ncbi:MAG: winged helix DNA-binding domain-containing protein [Actinomycetota bacterium]|nr:winged helix DNA-binding domain-containing protein [Actinomycetota bacterium]
MKQQAALRCSHRELNRAVLTRQHLVDRLPCGTTVTDAVAAVGPLQAQYNPSPFLAVLARVEGFTSAELRTALDSYAVVKASLMRGTLHVVAAEQYTMYASMVDGPVTRLWRTWLGKLLDVQPMQAALLDLTDPGPSTQQEVITFCQRWATEHSPPDAGWPPVGNWFFARCYPWLLRTAETTQLDSHKRDGYLAARSVRAEWAPPAREGSLAAAVRAYLGHFGPAGLDDIGKFLGESRIRPIREALADLDDEIVAIIDEDGRSLVDLAAAPRPSADLQVPVRLLPKFDSLTLAYAPANRGRTLPPNYYDGVIKTANGQIMATVLVDGMVAGTWTLDQTKRTVELTITPFGRWENGVRAQAAAEAERIAEFVAGTSRTIRVSFVH